MHRGIIVPVNLTNLFYLYLFEFQERDKSTKELKTATSALNGAESEVTVLSDHMKTMGLNRKQELEEAEKKLKEIKEGQKYKADFRKQEVLLEVAKKKVESAENEVSKAEDKSKAADIELEQANESLKSAKQEQAAAKAAAEKVNEEVKTVQGIVNNGWDRHPTPKELRLVVKYFLGIEEELTNLSQVVGADTLFNDNCITYISHLFKQLGYVPPSGYGIGNSNLLPERQRVLGKLMGLQ